MDTDTLIIDCDADPFVPECLQVEKHIKGGLLTWNPEKVMLHLDEYHQTGGAWLYGYELYERLRRQRQPVFNANVLDFLLGHTELIPESWKRRRGIFFWGTIYRDAGTGRYVRCLYWNRCGEREGDRWLTRDIELGYGFDGEYPALIAV